MVWEVFSSSWLGNLLGCLAKSSVLHIEAWRCNESSLQEEERRGVPRNSVGDRVCLLGRSAYFLPIVINTRNIDRDICW